VQWLFFRTGCSFFAGGMPSDLNDPANFYGTTRVDIYDIVTQTWSTAELSTPRSSIAAVACGGKIFFAGGDNGDGAFNTLYSTVDVYHVETNTWTTSSRSVEAGMETGILAFR